VRFPVNRLELAKSEGPAAPRVASRSAVDELFRALRARWPLILAAAVLAAVAAWILASMQPDRYRAASVAAVTPLLDLMPEGDRVRGVAELDQRVIVGTIAALADTPVIANRVLTPSERSAANGYGIRAIAMPHTNLLRVEVEGPDARRAATLANTVPQILGRETQSIFKYYSVAVVSPADPGEHVFPRVSRAVVAGLALGVLFGVALAWALERFRRSPA
jgi:capsular polysaccharide biosynthesis protein